MEALSLLIKPASGRCNMRCRYCFYRDVAESREEQDRGRMSLETLETLVQKALAETTGWVSFGFQGGEPLLMGLPFYQKLMEYEQKHNINGAEIANSIQTNGLLIDDDWAKFFAQNHFLVGLSIDGPGDIHNALRQDAADNGTHNRCLKAAETLTKHGADFNVLTVVTRQLAAHPDKVYRFYQRGGFKFVQTIACMDGLSDAPGSNPYSLDAESYGKFLCRLFDLWYEDFIKGDYTSVRVFDNWVRMLMGEAPDNCAMTGTCQSYPVVEADGRVYPCDFYALDQYQIGDVRTQSFAEMLSSDASVRFMAPSRLLHADCKDCPYLFICRGGCRRDREPLAASGAPTQNRYCEAYKTFFAHALPRMTDIARRMPRR